MILQKSFTNSMTPEQEQWFIQALQNHDRLLQNQQAQIHELRQNQQAQINEIREGQAMIAQLFREALDRFDERTRAIERRTDEMSQEIRDLRRDFLEFLHR
jgi:predicted  nucleic acid-binding Zn-ribbon protein